MRMHTDTPSLKLA
ncbi:hypothetical protein Taro_041399 [Colocasia esculenta]|uniref:Uncharacterized protein n=1 Tax=Colocasia esculenta TaxID=4460 RepID=A0A843WTF9_COLES|nr:hypothetical protein [Colocasia esculenta]